MHKSSKMPMAGLSQPPRLHPRNGTLGRLGAPGPAQCRVARQWRRETMGWPWGFGPIKGGGFSYQELGKTWPTWRSQWKYNTQLTHLWFWWVFIPQMRGCNQQNPAITGKQELLFASAEWPLSKARINPGCPEVTNHCWVRMSLLISVGLLTPLFHDQVLKRNGHRSRNAHEGTQVPVCGTSSQENRM